jgi:hypothetical protein
LIFARNYPVIHFVDASTAQVNHKLELAAPADPAVKPRDVPMLFLLRDPLRLATVHLQNQVRVWDLEDGRLLDTIEVGLGQHWTPQWRPTVGIGPSAPNKAPRSLKGTSG